ncbi:hypothetical protein ACFVT9_29070 [Kitasatospora cineracea]|uniref:hypothetical protein n=1 Tax=Kitasatospora cineracea TaxID=88074 RepID=UPI0036DD073E
MTHPLAGLDPTAAALLPTVLAEPVEAAVRAALREHGIDGPSASAVLQAAAQAAAATWAADHLTATGLLHLLNQLGTDLRTEPAPERPAQP